MIMAGTWFQRKSNDSVSEKASRRNISLQLPGDRDSSGASCHLLLDVAYLYQLFRVDIVSA